MIDEMKALEKEDKVFPVIAYDEKRALFDYNVGTVKKYGDRYRVTYQKYCLKKGTRMSRAEKGTVNDKKLGSNIRRAKSKIREYAMCNEWQYFVTLTLDKKKRNRYDLKAYVKALGQRIRDLNKGRDEKITYLLIPEQHKDGAWHMHGFINGLTGDDVKIVDVKGRKRDVYHWIDYEDKFGFSDMELIEDKDKATSYITKYVSKEMVNSVSELNAKTYYNSRGLKTSEVIKRGTVTVNYNPSYSVDFCDVTLYSETWVDDLMTAELCVYDNTTLGTWQYSEEDRDNPFGMRESVSVRR